MKIQWSEEDRRKIEKIAYFRWLDAGSPQNQDWRFWEMAEQEAIRKNIYHLEGDEELIEVSYATRKKMGCTADSNYFYVPYIFFSTPAVGRHLD